MDDHQLMMIGQFKVRSKDIASRMAYRGPILTRRKTKYFLFVVRLAFPILNHDANFQTGLVTSD